MDAKYNGADMTELEKCAAKGGCDPVVKRIEGLEIVAYDKNTGITSLNSRKVSWSAMGLIATIFAISGVGLIIWFSSIKAQAEDYPKVKEKLEAKAVDNATRITKLEEKFTAIDNLIAKVDNSATKLNAVIDKLDKKATTQQ
jgi:hypothetical protein